MKTRLYFGMGLFLFYIFVFSSCFSPFEGDETGNVRINFGSSENRSVYMPDEATIRELVHHIHLRGPTGKRDIWLDKGVTNTVIYVRSGHWDIYCGAYLDDYFIAQGHASINVQPGNDNSVYMTMHRVNDDPE